MIIKEESLCDDCMSYSVHCDSCPRIDEYDEIYSWDDLMTAMKNDGWKSIKDKEEWKHCCFDCIKKLMMKIQFASLIEENNE